MTEFDNTLLTQTLSQGQQFKNAHIPLSKIKSMSNTDLELLINGEIKVDGMMNVMLLTSLTNELNRRMADKHKKDIINEIRKLSE